MIPTYQGFCYLTKVQGRFEGAGETVRIEQYNGSWMLNGNSMQFDVSASASCVNYYDVMSISLLNESNLSPVYATNIIKNGPTFIQDLGPANDRFCFLTQLQGKFEGGGERIQIVADNGRLYFKGNSMQDGVGAQARCLVYGRVDMNLLPYLNVFYTATQTPQPRPGASDIQTANTRMLSNNKSFCALTGMAGRFKGGGERIEISESGGALNLTILSRQVDVAGSASCGILRLRNEDYL